MNVRDAILKGTTEAEQLDLIYKLFGTPTGCEKKKLKLFHSFKWKYDFFLFNIILNIYFLFFLFFSSTRSIYH